MNQPLAAGVDEERDDLLADMLHRVRMVARQAYLASRAEPEAVSVSNVEGLVLQFVDSHPGCRISAVAERLGLRLGNASAAVSGLADKGLVRREPDPADRRATTVWLTEAALANIAQVRRRWAEELGELDVDLDELRAAVGTLRKVQALLERDAAERTAAAEASPLTPASDV